jgi:hypothetical protein
MPLVDYGTKGVDLTWQAKFPETTPCVKCGKKARLAIVLREGSGAGDTNFACRLHKNDPEGEGFWLHDAAAFATYLCVDIDCATATTLWNQG